MLNTATPSFRQTPESSLIIEFSTIHDIFLFRRCEAKPKQSSLWWGDWIASRSLCPPGARNDGLRVMQYGNINNHQDPGIHPLGAGRGCKAAEAATTTHRRGDNL
jgi:hypothetical protein